MCKNHSHVAVRYIEQVRLGPLRLTVCQTVQPVAFEHEQVIARLVVSPGALVYIESPEAPVTLDAVHQLASLLAVMTDDIMAEGDEGDDAPPAVHAAAPVDLEA